MVEPASFGASDGIVYNAGMIRREGQRGAVPNRLLVAVGAAIFVVAVYLIASSGWAIVNEEPSGTNVIAFGDSLTHGTGAPTGQSYPDHLSRMVGAEIMSFGVPGQTTKQAMERLDEEVLQNDPKIVLLCLGGNDALKDLPEDQCFRNLETMIRQIQEKGALVILIGVSGSLLRPNYEAKFLELAKKTGCPLVENVTAGVSKTDDRIHPDAQGYRQMAEKIAPVLTEYLK